MWCIDKRHIDPFSFYGILCVCVCVRVIACIDDTKFHDRSVIHFSINDSFTRLCSSLFVYNEYFYDMLSLNQSVTARLEVAHFRDLLVRWQLFEHNEQERLQNSESLFDSRLWTQAGFSCRPLQRTKASGLLMSGFLMFQAFFFFKRCIFTRVLL